MFFFLKKNFFFFYFFFPFFIVFMVWLLACLLFTGKGVSIWDTFSHQHLILNNNTGDVACDTYHKVHEDILLLRDLKVNSHDQCVWPMYMCNVNDQCICAMCMTNVYVQCKWSMYMSNVNDQCKGCFDMCIVYTWLWTHYVLFTEASKCSTIKG